MRIDRSHRTTLWRIFVMALVFLVMSCESDGDGDGCLGGTDDLITGMGNGCGTGMTPIGDGCLGSCLIGGDGGCGDCGAGDGCIDMDCGDCGDCGSDELYTYDGDVVEGAVQVHVTESLFNFVNQELDDILIATLADTLDIDEDGTISFCLPRENKTTSAGKVRVCTERYEPDCDGSEGCRISAKIGDIVITPMNDDEVRIRVNVDSLHAKFGVTAGLGLGRQTCTVTLSKDQSKTMYAQLSAMLPINSGDNNMEVYVGGDKLDVNVSGLDVSISGNIVCGAADLITGSWLVDLVVGQVEDAVGAVTCRGCDTIDDCGAGATECKNNICRDGSDMCQGIQVGMDVGIDAGSLLQSFDPGAEAALGLRAYLGSYVKTNDNGLQLGGRLGAQAEPQSLCVPVRPTPAEPGKDSCRDGDNCPLLADLNNQGTIPSGPDAGEPFHLGAGVAMAGLNQILWSAYSSGALCLSVGGESDGLEILGTSLIGAFISSLKGLTYDTDQPIMIQLRPKQAPYVDFKPDEGQGAELDVRIPELSLDFYTVADQRYARIFTLTVDIELPLGVKAENNELDIALGDLTHVIDPDSIVVSNVEMVSKSEVESLVGNIPTIIGAAAGPLLGDDLIPSIEIPEIEGIALNLVGPGITILEENGEPAALGIFAALGFADENGSGLLRRLEPVVAELQIDMMSANEMQRFLVERRQFDEGVDYRDIMPRVVASMEVLGANVGQEDIEYAYSINGGPWSFWKKGPQLVIDNPMIANEDKYDVRITARRAGDPTSGSKKHAEFSFVNDYTAPKVHLTTVGTEVIPSATDNVYDAEELTMQYRINGGQWSAREALHAIELGDKLNADEQAVVEVIVEDPSGNARSERRTFGKKKTTAARTAAVAQSGGDDGCASAGEKGGLMAMLAFLGLVFLRRRKPETSAVAASPIYVALMVLTLLLLGLSTTGCKDDTKGLRGPGDGECDPACTTAEFCDDGVCVALDCSEDSDCPGSAECVGGECSGGEQACDRADDCEYGHICKEGVCAPSECTTSDECDQTMCDGDLLPFCDYDDWPSVEAGECVCSDSLDLREYGTWLRVVPLKGGDAVALTYNEYYGDLMFGVLDEDDAFEWTFIDGVPDGPVVGPPAGVRDGIREPGDDAGRYVSLVAEEQEDGFVLHAAYQYHDKSEDVLSLRYARGVEGSAGWTWEVIDIDDIDAAGMFPTISLIGTTQDGDDDDEDEDNAEEDELGIAIVYMTGDATLPAEDGNPAEYFTQVSTAYAATRTPESAEDFELNEGFDQAEHAAPCANLCDNNSACVTSDNTCAPTASTCDDCGSGEQCVLWDGEAQCLQAEKTTQGFNVTSQGVGLFSSSVVDEDNVVHVAYYDQVHGVLKYVPLERQDGQLVKKEEPLVVDGELDTESIGDVGRWTDIHLEDDKVVIFYEDAGRAELRAAVIDGSSVDITVLDDGTYLGEGQETVSNNRVGSSVYATPRVGGGFVVYYQDTTDMVVRKLLWPDLDEAPTDHPLAVFGTAEGFERDPTDEGQAADEDDQVTMEAAGAYGFFVNVTPLPGRTLFSSKRIGVSGKSTIMDVQTGVKDGGLIIGPVDPPIVDPGTPDIDF